MHELDPERLAISAADDRQDFAQGAELEPKHPIKKDRPVVIAVAETIRSGIEILLVTLRLEPKRVEMGMKVPARPIRANEHQRANGVACRLLHFGGGEFDAGTLRARLDLVADSRVYLRPAICAECGCEIVARNKRPVGALPGRPACGFPDRRAVFFQRLEEGAPLGVERLRIGLEAGLQILELACIPAVQERTPGERDVAFLTRHG